MQTNDDERQSYEDAFADQTPGVDLDEDNKAVFAAARAFLRRVEIQGGRLDEDLDPEIVATQIGQSAPSGRIAARHMLIYLRAASEVRRTATLKAGPNTSNIIKALHNLFTLEECGRRVTQTGEDMASPVVTHLWRAVATKLFVAFGIRNVNGNIDDHTRDSVCNGLQGLESILLYCMLSRQGQQVLRNRLNAILEVRLHTTWRIYLTLTVHCLIVS